MPEFHARFSPSSGARWIACPGSIAAQEALGEKTDDSSAASREGTAAHSLLEVCLVLGADPEAFRGLVLDPGLPAVDSGMVDGVQVALDWLQEYIEDYGRNNLIVIPERRVYIGPMIGLPEEDCNGTSDIIIVHKDMSWITVADYKHGKKAVEAKNNPQMMLYTCGGMYEANGRAVPKKAPFKNIRNIVIQPRAAKRHPVEMDEYKPGKLTTFMQKAQHAAQLALSPDAPRTAGEHCNFCRAKANCQTYRRRARAVAADEFGEIADPDTIPDEEVERVLEEAELLQGFIKSIKARALRMLQSGYQFQNFQLGWGRRTRQFESVEDLAEWCAEKGIPRDVYAPRTTISPAELEKHLRAIGVIKRRKPGEEFVSPIEHLVTYSLPSAAIKPRNGNVAEEDFDEVDS
jgi:hypothetical protein